MEKLQRKFEHWCVGLTH